MRFIKKHWLVSFILADLLLVAVIMNPGNSFSKGVGGKQQSFSLIDSIGSFFTGVVKTAKQITQGVAETVSGHPSEAAQILVDAPQIRQYPGLPRGCEVTSLAMLLQKAGVSVDKMELAGQIKKVPYYQNGQFGNPNQGFVGSMTDKSQPGYGVYHEPLAGLARSYLPYQIVDLSGKPFDVVLERLRVGIPVVVITNVTLKPLPDNDFQTWNTAYGKVTVTNQEHAVLVTGFDQSRIFFNNPLGGKNDSADKNTFIQAWQQMGSQAISYRKWPFF